MNSNSLNKSNNKESSNNSVLNISIDSSNLKKSNNDSLNNSFSLDNSFRNKINLPRENSSSFNSLKEEDEKIIIFSPKSNSDFDNFFLENDINKKRSKSQIKNQKFL